MAVFGSRKEFKVIVIGAGVTGLTLSHALTKAKIEHVVLEREDVAPAYGSSIGIHANGSRILDQLGCLRAVGKLCIPMKQFVTRLPNGRLLNRSDFFDFIAERNGYPFLNVERRAFLQAMFESLAEKKVIKAKRRITDIIECEEAIKVILSDALQTSYCCLLGIAPTPTGLGIRDMTCVHDHGFSFLFLSQPNQTYFFVFFKLPKQAKRSVNCRWTSEDADKAADSVASHPISDSLEFGELWRTRIRGQLVSVEEGIFKHWHFGRLVLAGDAAHKVDQLSGPAPTELIYATQVSPNFALGGNTGMESVVVLANELYRLKETTSSATPTKEAIRTTFQRYQELRMLRVQRIRFLSGLITRLQAFDGILMRCMAQWIVPILIGDKRIADQLGCLLKGSPKLDFIEWDSRRGTIPWCDASGVPDPKAPQPRGHGFQRSTALFAAINMKAVIIKEQGVAELADINEQSMRPKYIKVKTVAVALNPSH
ncbi:MAG: hypothetical protein Q9204_007775 [Flavoplaca sp. TL-2023a]